MSRFWDTFIAIFTLVTGFGGIALIVWFILRLLFPFLVGFLKFAFFGLFVLPICIGACIDSTR